MKRAIAAARYAQFKMHIYNNILRTIDKILSAVICAYSLLMVILLPIDMYNFLTEPDQYITVHNLDTTKWFWEFQYLKGTISIFFGGLAVIFFIFYTMKNKTNYKLQAARQILVFSLVGIMIYGYYQWYLTGFDH